MPDEKGVGEPLAAIPYERFDEGALKTGHGEDIEALSSESGSEWFRPTYIAVSSALLYPILIPLELGPKTALQRFTGNMWCTKL